MCEFGLKNLEIYLKMLKYFETNIFGINNTLNFENNHGSFLAKQIYIKNVNKRRSLLKGDIWQFFFAMNTWHFLC